jgi:hypothetical protein
MVEGYRMTDSDTSTGDTEQGCMRCGAVITHNRGSRLCDDCDKHIQRKLIRKGAACDRCNGHGMVKDPLCDIQRAMNGRDQPCPECGGSGRVDWNPDLDEVHPDLRGQVRSLYTDTDRSAAE